MENSNIAVQKLSTEPKLVKHYRENFEKNFLQNQVKNNLKVVDRNVLTQI